MNDQEYQFPDDTPDSVIDFAMKREAMRQGNVAPMAGPHMDSYFSRAESAAGRILDAFGQGAANNWGTLQYGPNKEIEDDLKQAGLFNDYENNRTALWKSGVELFARPLSLVVQALAEGPSTAIGGTLAATRQAAAEVGLPAVGEAIEALPELATATMSVPGITMLPGMIGHYLLGERLPPIIQEGLGTRVIGPGTAPEVPGTLPPLYTGQVPIRGREPMLPFKKEEIAPSPIKPPELGPEPGVPSGRGRQFGFDFEAEPTAAPEVSGIKIGDEVQWTSGGVDQFRTPLAVRSISEDGRWAFVEGSSTGIPVSELNVVRAAPSPVQPRYTPYPAERQPTPDITAPDEPPVEEVSPERPTEPVRPEASHVDANGDVRRDTLTTVEDVDRAIKQSAKPSTGRMPAPSQIEDLADAAGVNLESIANRDHGGAEEVEAKIKLLTESANDIHEAAAKVQAEPTNTAALAEFSEVMDRHWMVQDAILKEPREAEQVGVFKTAEAAREGKPISAEEMERASQLEQTQASVAAGVAGYTNPKQVSTFAQGIKRFIKDEGGAGPGIQPGFFGRLNDMLLELWINGLLSGLATHTSYAIGTSALLAYRTAETLGAGLIGKLPGHGPEKVFLGEAAAGLFGLAKGTPDGIRAAWEAGKTGLTVQLPGEKAASFAFSTTRAIPGLPGAIARLPTRGVAGIHSFNRMIGYVQGIAELSYRQAAKEGLTPGSAGFFARVKQLMDNPTTDMMEQARNQTTGLSLMSRGGPLIEWLAEGSNRLPALKWVMPFVRMAGNAVREGVLERTPVGLLSPAIWRNLSGRNGAIARDTQIARLAVSSAIGGAIAYYTLQGKITGDGPTDYREAALKRMTGWQPRAFLLGDTYYSYQHLGALAQTLATFANGTDVAHEMTDGDMDKAGGMLISSLAHSFIDEAGLRTLSEAFTAVEDSAHGREIADPGSTVQRFIRNQLSSFMPFSVAMGQTARATDPYEREARSIIDAYKMKIPGMREELLPRRDIFGEPIATPGALGGAGITAIYETQMRNDPIVQAMLRTAVWPGPVQRSLNMGGVKVDLTDEQHDDYARMAGRLTRLLLGAVVNHPGFDRLNPYIQQSLITTQISTARRMAAGQIELMYINTILPAAIREKQAEFGGALKPTKPVSQTAR